MMKLVVFLLILLGFFASFIGHAGFLLLRPFWIGILVAYEDLRGN